MELTKELLLHKFDYDRGKGVLIWKNPPQNYIKLKGKIAGSLSGRGYLQISLNGKMRYTHRLIFIIENGSAPHQIDHIDGVRTNNRIDNLRPTTTRANQQNRACHREGNLAGTTWHRKNCKWVAQIQVEGEHIYLGSFLTETEAHAAYVKAVKHATSN